MLKIKAIGVSEGLARAKALVIRDVDLTVVRNTVTDIEAEQQRALKAVENAKAQIAALRDETEKNIGPKEAEIFDAHLMMLEDPDFVEGMTNEIADESVCAEFACMVNCENFQAMFRAMDDEYMQARAADIGDISMRVLKNLKGIAENRARRHHRAVHRRRERPYAVGYREDGRQAGRRLYHAASAAGTSHLGHHGALDGHSGGRQARATGSTRSRTAWSC